jgi:hypothetical protein
VSSSTCLSNMRKDMSLSNHQVTSFGSSLLRHISRNIARSGVACRQSAKVVDMHMYLCYAAS